MSKAKDILSVARKQLTDHIEYETKLISSIVSGGEDNSRTEEEEWPYNPKVEVCVDNSYLDVEDTIKEKHIVTAIEVGNGRVQIFTEEGDELKAEDLSTDELYKIAECLEKTYKSLTNSK